MRRTLKESPKTRHEMRSSSDCDRIESFVAKSCPYESELNFLPNGMCVRAMQANAVSEDGRPWKSSRSAGLGGCRVVTQGQTDGNRIMNRDYLRGAYASQESRPQDGQRAYDGSVRHCGRMSSPRRTVRIEPFACAHCGSCPRV
jgi:hypothetical protein